MIRHIYAVLALLLLLSPSLQAQEAQTPIVQWTVTAHPQGSHYAIQVQATMQKGFHIWAMDAGGDGSLIPTSVNLSTDGLNWQSDWTADQEAHAERLEFIEGTVYSYSRQVIFTRTLTLPKGTKQLKGVITYQSCNESMCLPPEDVPFTVNIP